MNNAKKIINEISELKKSIVLFKNEIRKYEYDIEISYTNILIHIKKEDLVPAVASDLIEGNVIFGYGDDGLYCHTIEEVNYPNDDFKAYVADDGCRYGLLNRFKLKEELKNGKKN
jgi:hypothetical protein